MSRLVPAYFDGLIDGFHRGLCGRYVHLGYWEGAPDEHFTAAQARLDRLVLDLAGIGTGMKIADVGCGFGGTMETLNREFSGLRLTGVNIDERQLAICRQIAPANGNRLEWVECEATALPFPDDSLDRILCLEAMFHFQSRAAFFTEAARVLTVGGALCGTDIAIDAAFATDVSVIGPLQAYYGPWPDPALTEGSHAALARAAGLECSRWLDVTRETSPTYRFTAPDEDTGRGDGAREAAVALRRLHQQGALRYFCFRFDKTGP